MRRKRRVKEVAVPGSRSAGAKRRLTLKISLAAQEETDSRSAGAHTYGSFFVTHRAQSAVAKHHLRANLLRPSYPEV